MAKHFDRDADPAAPISEDRLTSFNFRVKIQSKRSHDGKDTYVVKFDDEDEARRFKKVAQNEGVELEHQGVKYRIPADEIASVVLETESGIVITPKSIDARVPGPP